MALSDDQVRRLARLARIAIRPDDSAAVVERLNRVLGLIDQLRAVDTKGIEPMSHAMDLTQRLRADAPSASEPREAYQKPAPAVEAGLYLVPKVIE
jgi:aspartyl-tRNA(Asn)/glutamyl-tRNA(Gln) amidotransferase subunit C